MGEKENMEWKHDYNETHRLQHTSYVNELEDESVSTAVQWELEPDGNVTAFMTERLSECSAS